MARGTSARHLKASKARQRELPTPVLRSLHSPPESNCQLARIVPDGWETLEAAGAIPFEIATLRRLAAELPDDFSVFHGVHWTRLDHGYSVYGEIDFIVVGPLGQVVTIEQKSGSLAETPEGLVKAYQNKRKNVAVQIQRSVEGLQSRFRHGHAGVGMALDYLLFCPDHRVQSPATAGIAPERIVDAGKAGQLAARITGIIAAMPPVATVSAAVVRSFLADELELAPDPGALVGQARQLVTRLSGGLATWARRLEFEPFRLRVIGTAGSGKTQLALRVLDDASSAGKSALYVCFNRPLADHLSRLAPSGTRVATFHTLADQRLRTQGVPVDYQGEGAFEGLTSAFIAAEPRLDDLVDELVVDEGQDFEQPWADALLRFLKPGGKAWWLEDPLQNLYGRPPVELPGWTTLRADANYRTPRDILRQIGLFVDGAAHVKPASPLEGDGIDTSTYTDFPSLRDATIAAIGKARAAGFKLADIVVLTYRGRDSSALMPFDRLGSYSLRRFDGSYDAAGNPVFDQGDILLETVYRFKGQSAPCIILTEVDFEELDERAARRLYVGATRATMQLAMVMSERAAGTMMKRLA